MKQQRNAHKQATNETHTHKHTDTKQQPNNILQKKQNTLTQQHKQITTRAHTHKNTDTNSNL